MTLWMDSAPLMVYADAMGNLSKLSLFFAFHSREVIRHWFRSYTDDYIEPVGGIKDFWKAFKSVLQMIWRQYIVQEEWIVN